MALFNTIMTNIHIQPPPAPGTRVAVAYNPLTLQTQGFNMQVLITETVPQNSKIVPKSVVIMGHFDTGASISSIDIRLAEFLGLAPIGFSTIRTANGEVETPNFLANLAFPNTALTPFEEFPISSCNLGYDSNQSSNARNFGILIGRDIMSQWNIVWNGPTSSVFISD
jgi:hypothetical protein